MKGSNLACLDTKRKEREAKKPVVVPLPQIKPPLTYEQMKQDAADQLLVREFMQKFGY